MKNVFVISMLFVIAGTAVAAPAVDEPSKLKLRREANVMGTVLLRDVIDFSAADFRLSEQFGDKPVFTKSIDTQTITISHDYVETRIKELGFNMSMVLFCGALECEVAIERTNTASNPETQPAAKGAPLWRQAAVLRDSDTTLAAAIRRHVQGDLNTLGGEINVEFQPIHASHLVLAAPKYSFDIRSVGHRGELGTRQFRVRISEDNKRRQSVTIYADVTLTAPVAIATRTLNSGNVIRPDDIELKKHVFNNTEDIGLTSLPFIIGQQVTKHIPKGQLVRKTHLKMADLVKRSSPVNVTFQNGGIEYAQSGRALDSGSYGELIRIELGTRKHSRIVTGVITGVGTVKVTEQDA